MGRIRYDFAGENVLVTGASRGIGFAVARAFALAGADVTVLSSGPGIHAAAEAIAKECARPCRACEADITDSASVRAALADLDRIDGLVHNAGREGTTPLRAPDEAARDTSRRPP